MAWVFGLEGDFDFNKYIQECKKFLNTDSEILQTDSIFSNPTSDVNSYQFLYYTNGCLNYLESDEG